jgi:transcription initiation factor TFIIIB Brf1 subunit/transcription initiation factor TFIIB
MDIKSTIRDARTTLANRRTERTARRRLENELAAFRTEAERAELDSVLERHTPEEAAEVRAILYRQAVERQLAGKRI